MKRFSTNLLIVVLASGLPHVLHADTNSQAAVAAPVKGAYKELAGDLKSIRRTARISSGSGEINASSGEAISAAVRIFKSVDFIGMSREAVLTLLGDPKTISDYGVTAKKGRNEPLVYRFDHGYGGVEYTIRFKDDVVTKVDTTGIE